MATTGVFTSRQLAEALGRLARDMNQGQLRNQPNSARRQLFRAKNALLQAKAFTFRYEVKDCSSTPPSWWPARARKLFGKEKQLERLEQLKNAKWCVNWETGEYAFYKSSGRSTGGDAAVYVAGNKHVKFFNYRPLYANASAGNDDTAAIDLSQYLQQIGPATYWVIAAFFVSGRAKDIPPDTDLEDVPHDRKLMQIFGIGPIKARVLREEHGITSYDELREAYRRGKLATVFSATQMENLSLYMKEDIFAGVTSKIPSAVIRLWEAHIEDVMQVGINRRQIPRSSKCCITGSFRRGKAFSGDIDLLVWDANSTTDQTPAVFDYMVRALMHEKTVRHILVGVGEKITSEWPGLYAEEKGDDEQVWDDDDDDDDGADQASFVNRKVVLAIGKLDSAKAAVQLAHNSDSGGVTQAELQKWRRVDIFRPKSSSVVQLAILEKTGSALFNEAMRSHARHQGYSLSGQALKHLRSGKEVDPANLKDEAAIFEHLDLCYVAPRNRTDGTALRYAKVGEDDCAPADSTTALKDELNALIHDTNKSAKLVVDTSGHQTGNLPAMRPTDAKEYRDLGAHAEKQEREGMFAYKDDPKGRGRTWAELRQHFLTASNHPKVLLPFLQRSRRALDDKYLRGVDQHVTPDMEAGTRVEPLALRAYERHRTNRYRKCELVYTNALIPFYDCVDGRPAGPWLAGSPDGVTSDGYLVEVKLARKQYDKLPANNMARGHMVQIQSLLHGLRLPYCHLIYYHLPKSATGTQGSHGYSVFTVKRSTKYWPLVRQGLWRYWSGILRERAGEDDEDLLVRLQQMPAVGGAPPRQPTQRPASLPATKPSGVDKRQVVEEWLALPSYGPGKAAWRLLRQAFPHKYKGGAASSPPVSSATQQQNLNFLQFSYRPSKDVAGAEGSGKCKEGITPAQLQVLRDYLCFFCAVYAPYLLPPEYVQQQLAWFADNDEARSVYEMSDYLDWKAYGYFRLEGHLRAGRYYHHRQRHRPPGKASVPGADVEPWGDRVERYKEYTRYRGTRFGLRATSRLPASGELELFVVAGALPKRGRKLVAHMFLHRIGKRRKDWQFYVNAVDSEADAVLASTLARQRRDAHDWVKKKRRRQQGGDDWTQVHTIAIAPPARPVVDAEVVRLMGVYGPNRVRGGTYGHAEDYDSNTTPTFDELVAKADRRAAPPRPAPTAAARGELSAEYSVLRYVMERVCREHPQASLPGDAIGAVAARIATPQKGTPVDAYLVGLGFRVLKADDKGAWLDRWRDMRGGNLALRAVEAPASQAFVRVVAAHASVDTREGPLLLVLRVPTKQGDLVRVVVPSDRRKPLMAALLGDDRLQSEFVGLATPALHRKLRSIFHHIPSRLVTYFNENMEVTQLHKRRRKIQTPRTVSGYYAGHRFGMDTTFMGSDPDWKFKLEGLSKSNLTDKARRELENAVKKEARGAMKFWPRLPNGDLISLAMEARPGWNDQDMATHAEAVDRGEYARRLASEVNATAFAGEWESGALSPWPYIALTEKQTKNNPYADLRFRVAAMGEKERRLGDGEKEVNLPKEGVLSPALLVTVIDMYSRKAWLFPAAAPGPTHLMSSLALRYAIEDGGVVPRLLTTDNGSEFHNLSSDKFGKKGDRPGDVLYNPPPEATTHENGVFYLRAYKPKTDVRFRPDSTKTKKSESASETFQSRYEQGVRQIKGKDRRGLKLELMAPKAYQDHMAEKRRKSASAGAPLSSDQPSDTDDMYKKQIKLMDELFEQDESKKYDNKFVRYAALLGVEVMTTKIPNYTKSGAHGPIERFHATFKLLLGKEMAVQAAAARRAGDPTQWNVKGAIKKKGRTGNPNLWCFTTNVLQRALDKYNNMTHGATGLSPNQLWNASRLLREKTPVAEQQRERAKRIVQVAEEHIMRGIAKKPKRRNKRVFEVGDWVRIHLSVKDNNMSPEDKKKHQQIYPDAFRAGHDINWTTAIYQVIQRRRQSAAAELSSQGIKDFDFFTYVVAQLDGADRVAYGFDGRTRDKEPKYSTGLVVNAEDLLLVVKEFVCEYPALARLPAAGEKNAKAQKPPRSPPSPETGEQEGKPRGIVIRTTSERTKQKPSTKTKSASLKCDAVEKVADPRRRSATNLSATLTAYAQRKLVLPPTDDHTTLYAVLRSQLLESLGRLPQDVASALKKLHAGAASNTVHATLRGVVKRSQIGVRVWKFDGEGRAVFLPYLVPGATKLQPTSTVEIAQVDNHYYRVVAAKPTEVSNNNNNKPANAGARPTKTGKQKKKATGTAAAQWDGRL